MPLVLIVDDNEKNRKLAQSVLSAAGFRTLEAATGAEAVAMAVEHVPDVVLMDLQLPDIPGTEATRELRGNERTAGIPVVALSAMRARGHRRLAPGGRFRRLAREAHQRSHVP